MAQHKESSPTAATQLPLCVDPITSEEEFRLQLQPRMRQVAVPSFHDQHLQLLSIITRLYGVMRIFQRRRPSQEEYQRLFNVLDELKTYAVFHFGDEEAYMQENRFPGLQIHQESHRRFVAKLLKIEAKVRNESSVFVVDLLHMVVSWLFDHINQMDMQYSKFAQGEPYQSPPEPTRSTSTPKIKTAPAKMAVADHHWQGYRNSLLERLPDVGVAILNKQHHQLAEQLVGLQSLVDRLVTRKPGKGEWGQVDGLLAFLSNYAAKHFLDEETLLRQAKYRDLESHCQEHANFSSQMMRMRQQLQQERQIQYLVDLHFFLLDWLLTHVSGTDVKYVSALASKGNTPAGDKGK
ncbi:MAG: hemerythrin family protein [Magnetococcales bacterium]|nr:hemerythrin family protein [Magnetococcales bacterium]